jgi:hypothetical protein
MKRRDFVRSGIVTAPLFAVGIPLMSSGITFGENKSGLSEKGFVPLFDGKTLNGWHSAHRLPAPLYPGGKTPDMNGEWYLNALKSKGKWTVEDGAIIGGQDPPGSGLGGYLVSDHTYQNFELLVDAKPDWPADTGILVRAGINGAPGIQVLLDHRKSGGIGGFYGNNLAGFHALPYNFTAKYDSEGNPIGLIPENPATSNEPVTEAKRKLLAYAAPVEDFLKAWKWGDWNTFKIRCEGKYAYLTTWINGVKICELDMSTIVYPNYNKDDVAELLSKQGHIAFEVHDNDKGMGKDRWGTGAITRWKNILLKEI